MAAADTLRQLIDAGKNGKRLDELSSARVIGKIAMQMHAAQQKAGAGKAVGPVTPNAIVFAPSGEVTFTPTETSSFGYSSPEQLGGSGDRRSDVFSLGTVLWEALTYQRLFDAMNDAAVKIAVKDREITSPSEANANVPAELSAICMRALSRNPSDRYQSLKSMAVEIEEFLSEAGYEDNDDKIKLHLEQLATQVKIELPSITRSAGGTQPPPLSPTSFSRSASASQPPPNRPANASQPPSILTTAPVERPSAGAALAAALQSASSSSTAVGVPAAPVMEPAPPAVPLVPMPPVLPGQTPLRNDKSTISVAVPPQVKVATNTGAVVEAKHSESKPTAVIIEEKPQALIVDDPTATSPGLGQTMREPAKVEAQVVEDKKPAEPQKKSLEAPPVVEAVAKVEATAEAKQTEAKAAAPKVEDKKPDAKTKEAKADAKKTDAAPKKVSDKKSAPHPAAAVSLGAAPRDSKGDVLAGWGWGTDKHNAITAEEYDDQDFHAPPDNKKTLMYVIGGGVAVAAMVTIIAMLAGGSHDKKKPTKPIASAQAVESTAPPPPTNDTAAAGSATTADQGSATAAGSAMSADQGSAMTADQGSAADQAAAEKAAADQAAAEKAAADQAAADKAAADKVAAEKAAADEKLTAQQTAAEKKAAAKLAAEQAAADKKAAAELAAADKKAAAQVAAEKKAAAAQALADKRAADKAAAEQKAAEKKAAAETLAADRKAAQEKAAADKKALAATNPTTRPKTTTKTETKVAKADTKTAKVDTKTTAKVETKADAETTYRQGLQQFARGDTAGALASLRSSLAANPNYAPTWRGLGLVFEKMGEKEQARSAYKRYLQLAPSATDTEQIKGRLERLSS